MLKLNNLSSPKGANKDRKRIGRGQGSGQGTQAGKGHKGQKARKSGGVRLGFEGGSMPIFMRLPKRGFKNIPFKKEFSIINLEKIESNFTNEVVSREALISKGLLKGNDKRLPIKILGVGGLKKNLSFKGIERFSKSAREAILKIGGKIE
jgi:large subunit ribosomal protein L15